MARNVFMHIGAPKTGTTYLQAVMSANRDVMLAQGVRYADGRYPSDRVHAAETARGLRHVDSPRARGAWRRILDQVHEHEGDAVVSHEFFGACTAEQARRVIADLAPARVHVVFTARDYVRQATAVWQERLKYARAAPLSDFTLRRNNGTPMWSWRTQDVVAILRRWSEHIPAGDVHLVTVPPPGADRTLLWQRFATTIGVDPASCATEVEFENSSLGVVEAELLRRVDTVLPEELREPAVAAKYVRNVLANKVLTTRRSDRLTTPQPYAEKLVQLAKKTVVDLEGSGYHVVGDLSELIPAPSRPGRLPDDVGEGELLDSAVHALAGLLAAMAERDSRAEAAATARTAVLPTVARTGPVRRALRLARRLAIRSAAARTSRTHAGKGDDEPTRS